MPSEILRDYHRMNLDQKYEFTFAGYVFGEYPNHQAIYVDRTKMTTEPGFDRWIRVGTTFKKLPPGFIILFPKLEVTNVMSTGNVARYQVRLNDTSYLQPHTGHCTPYGLAQLPSGYGDRQMPFIKLFRVLVPILPSCICLFSELFHWLT